MRTPNFKKLTLFFCILTFISEPCFANDDDTASEMSTPAIYKNTNIYVDGQRIKFDPYKKHKDTAKKVGVAAAATGFFLPPVIAMGMAAPPAAAGGVAAL